MLPTHSMQKTFVKTLKTLTSSLPIMIGVLLLIGLLNSLFQENYAKFFSGNFLIDPLIGSILGSISFSIPLTSYIIGGELLESGVSLLAVTAFIMTWTTVGVAMVPLEAKYLGKKFAIVRNIINFFFSIIIAILTILIVNLFK